MRPIWLWCCMWIKLWTLAAQLLPNGKRSWKMKKISFIHEAQHKTMCGTHCEHDSIAPLHYRMKFNRIKELFSQYCGGWFGVDQIAEWVQIIFDVFGECCDQQINADPKYKRYNHIEYQIEEYHKYHTECNCKSKRILQVKWKPINGKHLNDLLQHKSNSYYQNGNGIQIASVSLFSKCMPK